MGVSTPQFSAAITGRFMMYQGNELVSVDASTAQSAMELGTAALEDIGTSGANVPLLNGANTWSSAQSFSSSVTTAGSFVHNGSSDTTYAMDTSQRTSVVANAALVGIVCNFSGIVIVNNNTSGHIRGFVCGGGATSVFADIGGGVITAAYAPAQAGYAFYNNSGATGTFTIMTLRTRVTA